MLIDLTAVDTKKDRPKFERHSQNILQLIREAGLEEVTSYKAYATTYTLSYQDSFERTFQFKPRGYKKQVQEFIAQVLVPTPSIPRPSHIGTEIEDRVDEYISNEPSKKYSFFDIAKDMTVVLEKGAEVETDEEMEAIVILMEKQDMALEKKAESFIKYHRHNEYQVKNIDEEIAYLQKQRAKYQRKVDQDIKLAEKVLEFFKVEKIECTYGKITTSKSKSLEVTGQVPEKYLSKKYTLSLDELKTAVNPMDEEFWTDEEVAIYKALIRVSKLSEAPKKKEITDAIKNGEEIDFAYLKENKKGVIK